ncbi:uncharacterized protein LOC103877219 [Papio anubis]|uniref:uncharacterized protein LOC103877219 n=1 Tax=Papio anubis TaxID=9555 RepID=UPI000B7B4E33|nr:uncharacterized protein LOC103877219 [Papio anubis]
MEMASSEGPSAEMEGKQGSHAGSSLFAGTAILFPQGGADSHCLCLVCPAGQHSMAGSNLQCPMGFHCQDGVMTPWPGPTSTCRGLPELTDSEDCQQCPPGQEPGPQCSSCIFCSLRYFRGRSPSCQPCPSGSGTNDKR